MRNENEVKVQYLGTKKASEFLDVKPVTLKLYVSKGMIKAEKSKSGKLYFDIEELKKFITNK